MIPFTDELITYEQQCLRESECYVARYTSIQEASFAFEQLLRLLYYFSICYWGCKEQGHLFEYLAGRIVNHGIASRRLIMTGYYDEALSLVRGIGEIANLLNLFWVDTNATSEWLNGDDRFRKKEFSPVAVRKKLEQLGAPIPIDQIEYATLSELVTHPSPSSRPNAHEVPDRPVVSSLFQEQGFKKTIWRLYWAIGMASGPIARLAPIPREQEEKLVELTIELVNLCPS